jgi:hypothetical protein
MEKLTHPGLSIHSPLLKMSEGKERIKSLIIPGSFIAYGWGIPNLN